MEYETTIDITSKATRKRIIEEIEGDENLRRKEESFARFEIYRERQKNYIKHRLISESSKETVDKMRKFTSINFTRKMIKELASIYKHSPIRSFTDVSDDQSIAILNHYERMLADVKLKKSNKYFKLHEQACIQTIPKFGQVQLRVYQPHHYDVVPNEDNPEVGEVYIISSFDRSRSFITLDSNNQLIADPDDWRVKKVYYWWSREFNFSTNYQGDIITPSGIDFNPDYREYLNPIGMLNFTDIATEKDFEYWVRTGSSITEFNIEFGASVSDVCNISKIQGYSQAVFKSVEKPTSLAVGPHQALWLKIDPADTESTKPEFAFVSPSPDLNASISLNENLLRMFLASRDMSFSTGITDKSFSSGLERLLASIEKWEASQDDLDLYLGVEKQVFRQFKAWNNYLESVNERIPDSIRAGMISDQTDIEVEFLKPEMIQTRSEKLDYISKQLDLGLMSDVEAIQELRGVSEDAALSILDTIKKRSSLSEAVSEFMAQGSEVQDSELRD